MPLFTDNDRLRWVSDGQKVTLGLDNGKGLPCVVLNAAGDWALVRSLPNGTYEKWVEVWRLFPEIPAQKSEGKP